MIYYHGSPIIGLKLLKPNLSNHNRPYVYFTSNYFLSHLYTVNCNFYPYGFIGHNKDIIDYDEYYENQIIDIYENKSGSIYSSNNDGIIDNPTIIHCAYVSTAAIKVESECYIDNIYLELLKHEKSGFIKINRFKDISQKQKDMQSNQIYNEIIKNKLYNESTIYSNFIKNKFPVEWEKAINENLG